jgi:ankyrin repeat protein
MRVTQPAVEAIFTGGDKRSLNAQLLEDIRSNKPEKRLGIHGLLSLLSAGANPNSWDASGCTPFMYASLWGMKEHMKLLRQWNADVGAANQARATALIIVSCFPDNDGYDAAGIMTLVLELAKQQYRGDTPQFKAFVNAKNREGESALHCARIHGFTKLVDILKANGATD